MLIRGVDRSDRQREPAQTLRAALEADEALREKLLACDVLDEMAALLAGHGVEVTSQELVSLGRALPPPDEELGEDDLEEVAGAR